MGDGFAPVVLEETWSGLSEPTANHGNQSKQQVVENEKQDTSKLLSRKTLHSFRKGSQIGHGTHISLGCWGGWKLTSLSHTYYLWLPSTTPDRQRNARLELARKATYSHKMPPWYAVPTTRAAPSGVLLRDTHPHPHPHPHKHPHT
jgi:hypothetical protein